MRNQTSHKTPILESFYFDNFIGVNSNTIFLLSDNESAKVWTKFIDEHANSYFRLKNDNWLISNGKEIIGNWQNDYNNKLKNVQELLSGCVTWSKEDKVFFCMKKTNTIEAKWSDFIQYWSNFIECEDDCPILINENQVNEAVIFRPIGDIVLVK